MAIGQETQLQMARLLRENDLLIGKNFDTIRANENQNSEYLGILALGIQEFEPDVIVPLVPSSASTGPALDLAALMARKQLNSVEVLPTVLRGIPDSIERGPFSYDFMYRDDREKFRNAKRAMILETVRVSDNRIVALIDLFHRVTAESVLEHTQLRAPNVLTVVNRSNGNRTDTALSLYTKRQEVIVDLSGDKTVYQYLQERDPVSAAQYERRVPGQPRHSPRLQRIRSAVMGR